MLHTYILDLDLGFTNISDIDIWFLFGRVDFFVVEVQTSAVLIQDATLLTQNAVWRHVGPHVVLELDIPGGRVATLVTPIWLNTSVGPHVGRQLIGLHTREGTQLTMERVDTYNDKINKLHTNRH